MEEHSESLAVRLEIISKKEIEELKKRLPSEPSEAFVLLTDLVRVMDSWALAQTSKSATAEGIQALDIMRMGWNILASCLLKTVPMNGFPITSSTKKSRNASASLLYHAGCSILLKRTADMVRANVLYASFSGKSFEFHKSNVVDFQFNDTIEFDLLDKLEDEIEKNTTEYYQGWSIKDADFLKKNRDALGNYIPKNDWKSIDSSLVKDIESHILQLVKPWDSGYGIMTAYDSSPEVDRHYLALASKIVKRWKEDAGIYHETDFDGFNGGELVGIVMVLTSFCLKHIEFVLVAKKKYPEISTELSLTIWTPANEMIEDISDFTGFKKETVAKIFDAISITEKDAAFLQGHTSKFMPVFISLGNGYVLRPTSCISHNPFTSIIALLENRKPHLRNIIAQSREPWFREYLYTLFYGTRYQTVKGNIKLKSGGVEVTDIDAAVYDNLTGELALFQLKWQDFFTNDVRKLRSKASNLVKDLDTWASEVNSWIEKHGINQLEKSLRLRSTKHNTTKVYLMGISRNQANTKGYGYTITNDNIAICNWPQFVRNRLNVGPAERVISLLFSNIRRQYDIPIKSIPTPLTFEMQEYKFSFPDLWSKAED